MVEGLEIDMFLTLTPDGDMSKIGAKLGALGGVIKTMADELDHMRMDATDAALLAKITGAQAVVVALAKRMRGMTLSADTLPFESDIYKAVAQIRRYCAELAATPMSPSSRCRTRRARTPPWARAAFNASEAQMMDQLPSKTLEKYMTATDRLTQGVNGYVQGRRRRTRPVTYSTSPSSWTS